MMEACKRAAAEKAATVVKNGMIVGLGTGSTATYFIEALIKHYQQGLQIQVVASSIQSQLLAHKGGLPVLDPSTLQSLDLYVDGADEIDPQKQMIKGAGGALLREKILARMSREMIVVIDETKLVSKLGTKPLPIEVIPFGLSATLYHLQQLGYQGVLRLQSDGLPWITENHNYIYDILLSPSHSIEQDHFRIRATSGVVETGFFQNQAGRVIIGFKDGSVVVQ